MLPLDLTAVDEAWLREACANRMPESSRLDWKRELPARTDDARAEFAKDVAALANADGGDLVYGVAEHDGGVIELAPIDSESADAAERRLRQVAEDAVEPRIPGLQARAVPIGDQGYVLVIRVPASFEAPHRARTRSGAHRFVARRGTLTVDLTYAEIRAMFDRTATLVERARSFRDERLALIDSRRISLPLSAGGFSVLHVIPLQAFAGRAGVDVSRVYHDLYTRFSLEHWNGASRSFNFEGVAAHAGMGPFDSYAQVFRSGTFEVAHAFNLAFASDVGREVCGPEIAHWTRDSIGRAIDVARRLSISGAAIVGLSLVGVQGHVFEPGRRWSRHRRIQADRPLIVTPEQWIEQLADVVDVDAIARPMLDVTWQAFGIPRCVEYSDRGEWLPPAR